MTRLAAVDAAADPRADGDPAVSEPARGGLAVSRLDLTDFRNYAALRLEAPDNSDGANSVVALVGPNGAGKTNLLEALSFLAPGRGLRGARLSDLARRVAGEDGQGRGGAWAVSARVVRHGETIRLGTGCTGASSSSGGERRGVRIDGETARGQASLAEVVSMVWLTPRMDRIFDDGPAARRRFLDRMVFGFDPAHAGRLAAYEQALRERTRLLREQAPGRRADPAWLSAVEDTLATRGVAIAAARRDLVQRLDQVCAAEGGAFPRAGLALKGMVEAWLEEGPALDVEERIRRGLANQRDDDAQTGGAGIGPHRSDIAVRHRDKDLPMDQCSTGEQKAVLIAIVLADARLQALERGYPPILLLDEVAAHLDAPRRRALFDTLRETGAQAWLTGTDSRAFAPIADDTPILRVDNGTISPTPAGALGR